MFYKIFQDKLGTFLKLERIVKEANFIRDKIHSTIRPKNVGKGKVKENHKVFQSLRNALIA